jgi:hypothetical protein
MSTIPASIYDSFSTIESKINFIKNFETSFNRETGTNDHLDSILIDISIIDELLFLKSENRNGNSDCLNMVADAIKYTRNIHNGRGLKDLTYSFLFTLHSYHHDFTISVLKSIIEHDHVNHVSIGCWKDVRNYVEFIAKYSIKGYDDPRIPDVLNLYNVQLREDIKLLKLNPLINPRNAISFAAKYAPREKKYPEMFDILVRLWSKAFSHYTSVIEATNKSRMLYRKMVSDLNRQLDTLEIKECDKMWSTINPTQIPQNALTLKRDTLIKKCPDTFLEFYKTNDKYITYKTAPWKIVKNIITANEKNDEKEIEKWNDCWNNYVKNQLCEEQFDNKEYLIPILDVSQIMFEKDADRGNYDLYNAIASACSLAAKSAFGNKLLTFSHQAVWVDLDDCPLNIAVQRIIGLVYSADACPCCSLNVVLNGFINAHMTSEDVSKLKIVLITKTKMYSEYYKHINQSWKKESLKKCGEIYYLDNRNFVKLAI